MEFTISPEELDMADMNEAAEFAAIQNEVAMVQMNNGVAVEDIVWMKEERHD